MEKIIADILPHSVAVALSPMPIAALSLLLLSKKAKANSIAFSVGWILALIINVGLFALIFKGQEEITGPRSSISQIINGILGIFLLFLSFKQFKARPLPGKTPTMPKWMEAVESFSPIKSFFTAFLLVTINAKNTVIDISTGVYIGKAATSISEGISIIFIYSILSSLTILIPVIGFLLWGGKLQNMFNNLKAWLVANNATILFVLFLILGVNLISKALGG